MIKKILFFLCFMLIMSGCSLNQENSDTAAGVSEEVMSVSERNQVEIDFNQMDNLQLIDDICYFTRYEKLEEAELKRLECYRWKKDETEELLYAYEEKAGESFYLMCNYVDALENWYNLYELETQQEGIQFFLEKRNEEGNLIYQTRAEIFQETLSQEAVMGCGTDDQGIFCAVTYDGSVLFWNAQGEEDKKGSWKEENEDRTALRGIVTAGEAGTYRYLASSDSLILQRIDFEHAALEKETEIKLSDMLDDATIYSVNVTGVYSGWEDGIYLVTEDGLWQYAPQKDELTRLFGWMDDHVGINYEQVRQIGKSSAGFTIPCYDKTLQSSNWLVIKKQTADKLTDKVVITLGCQDTDTFLDNIKSLVREYNAQSDRYQIEVVTYGQRSETGITTGAVDELTMALLQGDGPDLFDLSGISVKDYAAKGILEDLTPYLEKSGIELVETVEKALRIDEKLYALSDQFTFMCMLSPEGYSQDGGLSIQQCINLSEAYPDALLMSSSNKNILLDYMMNADMDAYVDFRSGTCSFDSEEFINLLKIVNNWKDGTLMPSGLNTAEELYQHQYLIQPVTVLNMVSYLEIKEIFSDFAVVSGYPNWNGEELYPINFPSLYGINSASQNKEGAWDVIQYLLLMQKEEYFSVTAKAFEEALYVGQNESSKLYSRYTGEELTGLVPDDGDREEIKQMLSHIYVFNSQQREIAFIISEEAKTVFNGSKTPEQAAQIIQSRVSIYLSEQ